MHCERLFFNNFLGKLAFGLSVASIVCTIIVAIVIVALYFALFYGNYTFFIHYSVEDRQIRPIILLCNGIRCYVANI